MISAGQPGLSAGSSQPTAISQSSPFEHVSVPESLQAGSSSIGKQLVHSFTGEGFDVGVYLNPSLNPPTREKASDYLLAVQRNSDSSNPHGKRIDYGGFLSELPVVHLPETTARGENALKISAPERSALSTIMGLGSRAPWNDRIRARVMEKYAQDGQGMFQLITDLQRVQPSLDATQLDRILRFVHGDLRTEAYQGLAQLEMLSKDTTSWERVIDSLMAKVTPTKGEVQIFQKGQFCFDTLNYLHKNQRMQRLFEKGSFKWDEKNPKLLHDTKSGKTYDLRYAKDVDQLWSDRLAASGGQDYKDYYAILGVGQNADVRAIKIAYRKLARKLHPDVNSTLSPAARNAAEEQFKEVNEAYEVLSDSGKREKYDGWQSVSGKHDTTHGHSQPSPSATTGNGNGNEFLKEVLQNTSLPTDFVVVLGKGGNGKVRYEGRREDNPIPGGRTDLDLNNSYDQEVFLKILRNRSHGNPYGHSYQSSRRQSASDPKTKAQQNAPKNEEQAVFTDFEFGSFSDRGRVRETNEDSHIGFEFIYPDGQKVAFNGVFDGMGGHAKGEVASQMARDWFKDNRNAFLKSLHYVRSDDEVFTLLRRAFDDINESIRSFSNRNPIHNGMGTTGTVALFFDNRVYFANVGDSRAYIVDSVKNQYRQITNDHSWVQEQCEAGNLTQEEAASHPKRNLLTRSLGNDSHVRPDFFAEPFAPGQSIVLTTDGLTNLVKPQEIATQVIRNSPSIAAKELIGQANHRGGSDNITIRIMKRVK